MRSVVILIYFIAIGVNLQSQVAINTDGSVPHSSAMLDIASSNKGLLLPRITNSNYPASPEAGLIIYNSQTNRINLFNSTYWGEVLVADTNSIGDRIGQLYSPNSNLLIGNDAGRNLSYGTFSVEGKRNVFIGESAGLNSTTSSDNVFIGNTAGYGNIEGFANVYIGARAGQQAIGSSNVLIGRAAGNNLNSFSNVGIGESALHDATGSGSVAIGAGTGKNSKGDNVFIGNNAGNSNTGKRNVFIGYRAGYNETGFSRLYIETSSQSDPNNLRPLIYGEFDNDRAGINWDSSISLPATLSVNGTLHIEETAKLKPLATAPGCISGDEGLLYFDSGLQKLRICTSTGWIDLH